MGPNAPATSRRHPQTRRPRRRTVRSALRPTSCHPEPPQREGHPDQRPASTHPVRPRAHPPTRTTGSAGPHTYRQPLRGSPLSGTKEPCRGCSPADNVDGRSRQNSSPNAYDSSACDRAKPAATRSSSSPPNYAQPSWPECSGSTSMSRSPGNLPAQGTGPTSPPPTVAAPKAAHQRPCPQRSQTGIRRVGIPDSAIARCVLPAGGHPERHLASTPRIPRVNTVERPTSRTLRGWPSWVSAGC